MTRVAVAAVILALHGWDAAAQQVTWDGTAAVATGTYFFTERTTTFSLSNGLTLRSGAFSLRASLPIWLQNTTLVTTTGTGGVPSGGPYGREAVHDSGEARQQRKGQGGGQGHGLRTPQPSLNSGNPDVPAPGEAVTGYRLALADPMIQAGVRIADGSRASLSTSISAKIPVADSTLGTGKWDLGGSLSGTLVLSSRVTAGLDVSYWYLGDLPDFDFRDPFTAGASLGTLLGRNWGALVSLWAGSSAIRGYDPPVWLGASVNRLGGAGSIGLTMTFGLTETVPDAGLALVWSIRLRQ